MSFVDFTCVGLINFSLVHIFLTNMPLHCVLEFLVRRFPYDVPTEGQYSYLPRLLGRAKVTFTMRRKNKIMGNFTIVADGFAAPITAGNFVDLSVRNFYTGLPIKLSRKKIGRENEFEVATIPVLGSFQEGMHFLPVPVQIA